MKTPLRKACRRAPGRGGFTLIELLVVISIIGVLAAIALPVFGTVRRKSQQVQSMSNLRQWGVAMINSVADHGNMLPWKGQPIDITDDSAWYNQLPPYVNEKAFSDASRGGVFPRAGEKSVFINPAVPLSVNSTYKPYLFCYAENDYLSSAQAGSTSGNGGFKTMPFAMIEHPSACVFMAEKSDDMANCDPAKIKAYFGSGDVDTSPDNGANFVFCDGHVQLLTRRDFDPKNNTKALQGSASNQPNVAPDTSFTYVPFQGATQ